MSTLCGGLGYQNGVRIRNLIGRISSDHAWPDFGVHRGQDFARRCARSNMCRGFSLWPRQTAAKANGALSLFPRVARFTTECHSSRIQADFSGEIPLHSVLSNSLFRPDAKSVLASQNFRMIAPSLDCREKLAVRGHFDCIVGEGILSPRTSTSVSDNFLRPVRSRERACLVKKIVDPLCGT
jgi:hypothetical protein